MLIVLIMPVLMPNMTLPGISTATNDDVPFDSIPHETSMNTQEYASLLASQGQALNGRKLLGEVHTSDYDGPGANRNPHYGAPPPLREISDYGGPGANMNPHYAPPPLMG
ncbi:hypothetical protein SELMODRAFT_424023 [Selaginella moellendorffii]|uniref:Uncharacterized protein n=1 Tax=Selaginella moellendorffii TaxID=88036 RepID=D8SNJ6_SELML|nr:hypothetical protein SELMODRAFT_424969 [Selaginella moellendorffii]EFJ14184.1 hypothetical protein SELMODRAFT_424023 [Selaginella moellendorffii]